MDRFDRDAQLRNNVIQAALRLVNEVKARGIRIVDNGRTDVDDSLLLKLSISLDAWERNG